MTPAIKIFIIPEPETGQYSIDKMKKYAEQFENEINTWIVNNIDKDIRVHTTSTRNTTTIVIQYNTGDRNKTDSLTMNGDVLVVKADKRSKSDGV